MGWRRCEWVIICYIIAYVYCLSDGPMLVYTDYLIVLLLSSSINDFSWDTSSNRTTV
jgi:hypothetical protein